MSESDKKTPTVSPVQGATSETATIVPKELESEWLQFLEQKEYEEDMALIEHDSTPPPLPSSGFEDEIDFVYSMWLKDEIDHNVADLPYEALEALAKQQTKILKECKERIAKAKEDGDVNYELRVHMHEEIGTITEEESGPNWQNVNHWWGHFKVVYVRTCMCKCCV